MKKSNGLLLTGTLFGLAAFGAQAQDAGLAPFSALSPWMLGDWGGLRSDLQQEGVNLTADYVMESASNLAGGYNRSTTARYSDQWLFAANLDLNKLLGWQDSEFQVSITNRDGQNLGNHISDPRAPQLSSPQEVYGRGQTWRLSDFWLRKGFFDGGLDIKLGRDPVGEDFATVQTKFQNLTLGPNTPSRNDRWINWPVSQWMARARVVMTPDWYIQVGIYNQNPANGERGDGFRLDAKNSIGNLVPAELVWHPQLGGEGLPGIYKLGGYYSSPRSDVYSSWQEGAASQTDHGYGGYAIIQQQLTATDHDKHRGLVLTVTGTLHDHRTASVDSTQTLAMVWKGPMDWRQQDEIGLGVARLHVNNDYSRMLERTNQYRGVSEDAATYLPVQKGAEYDYELYYNIHATRWLDIRPNLQYVVAPGAVSSVRNAFIAGLTANINI